ncbi:XRE family transcriptional regulator, partial [Photobacterium damselae subsp. damselae]|uniref:helix-turn-helix domain-containing protein n=1 Tax=Photobacterium damselae TaxID=38293 RepID=UPI000D061267
MESPLRKLRKSKGMTLEDLQKKMQEIGQVKTIPHLSLVERGLVWPSREVVDALVEIFQGEINEVQVLYP